MEVTQKGPPASVPQQDSGRVRERDCRAGRGAGGATGRAGWPGGVRCAQVHHRLHA